MVRRAAWRSREGERRDPLARFVQDADGVGRFVADELTWAILAIGALCFVEGKWLGGCLAVVFASGLRWLLLGFAALTRAVRASRRSREVQEISTRPGPARPYPCRIEVSRKGALLGSDLGVVSFVDGWLHYDGRRTSFALRRADVASSAALRLDLVAGGTVAFAPEDRLQADGIDERDLAERFQTNLASWLLIDSPEGESILPPQAAHASGKVRTGSDALASILIGVPTALFVQWWVGTPWSLVFALPFGIGTLRSLADLCRLARTVPALPSVVE